jgi:hypothetical protein
MQGGGLADTITLIQAGFGGTQEYSADAGFFCLLWSTFFDFQGKN